MEGAHMSFISSTYWTESVGPAAAVATLNKMRNTNVPAHVAAIGGLVMDVWKQRACDHGLPVVVGDGYPCFANFRFQHHQSEQIRTLFTQLMLAKGFLAGLSVYPTLSHTEEIVRLYEVAVDESFAAISEALREDRITQLLR
jgi:glutamate-1-semialdehyde 2,1-aminomutase